MTREIKFRAWDTEEKRFNYNPKAYINDGEINYAFENTDFIWQQFTGLKDKQSKDIYEGDVILNVWGYFDVPFQIVWDLYGFRLKCLKQFDYIDKDQYIDCPTHIEMTEIIGNIFENPELIN